MKYLIDLHTERIHFGKIDPAHFDEWLPFFLDPNSFKHWKQERKRPEVECEEWYLKQSNRYAMDRGGMNSLIEKSTGKLIGHAGLLVQEVDGKTELEVAYSLVPEFRGKGYAREAAKACRDYAFTKGYAKTLVSIISTTNVTSADVAIHNGMRRDRDTVYKENKVTIFRINRDEWEKLSTHT